MTDAADLLAAAARTDALALECARYCAGIDPGNIGTFENALRKIETTDHRWPFEAPRAPDFSASEGDRAVWIAEVAARRLAYLEGRASILRERQAFRDRLREPSLPDLDGAVDAITNDRASLAEVATENAQQRVAAIQRTRETERQRLREARVKGR
jgi:hypothetical protein